MKLVEVVCVCLRKTQLTILDTRFSFFGIKIRNFQVPKHPRNECSKACSFSGTNVPGNWSRERKFHHGNEESWKRIVLRTNVPDTVRRDKTRPDKLCTAAVRMLILRFRDFSLPGIFAPHWELSLTRTKVPGNFRSKDRMFQGTFILQSNNTREQTV